MASTNLRMPRVANPTSSPTTATRKQALSEIITSKGSGLPNRYILHAVEKFGKTSLLTHAPKPIFIQTRGEQGLETLIDAGQIQPTEHFPEAKTFAAINEYIQMLTEQDHDYKTLVLDTINGAEVLMHEFICARDYNNDWSERGFLSYKAGYETSLSEARLFLQALDKLRATKKMTIFLLCHTKVKTFNNPTGANFDRYQPDLHEKTWSLFHKWADVILFGNFEAIVTESNPKKKGKGTGGQARIIYTVRHDAYDAGNRLGLPPDIDMGESVAEGWKNLLAAIKEARQTEQTGVTANA